MIVLAFFLFFSIALLGGMAVFITGASSLQECLQFLCRYYEIYFYVISALTAFGLFLVVRKQKTRKNVMVESIFRIVLMLFVLASAYGIYRMPIITDVVTIKVVGLPSLENGEKGRVEFNGYTSFDKKYSKVKIVEGNWIYDDYENIYIYQGNENETEEIKIELPISVEWKLHFITGPEAGSVEVWYKNSLWESANLQQDTMGIRDLWIVDEIHWQTVLKDCAIKVSLIFLSTFVLCFGADVLFNWLIKRKNGWLRKYNYECAIFIALFLHLLLSGANKIQEYCAAWYAVDYSIGTGSRFLLGAFVSLLTDGYVTDRTVYLIVFISLVIVIGFLALLLGKCIRSAKDEIRLAVAFVVACYLCSPVSIAGCWNYGNMGRLETFGILFTLIAICVYHTIDNMIIKYGLIAVLCILSIAAHQGWFFLYFSVVFSMLIYDVLRNHRINVKPLIGSSVVFVVTVVSFLYFQLRTKISFNNVSDLQEYLLNKTNLPINGDALSYEYFSEIKDVWKAVNVPHMMSGWCPRERLYLTVCLLIPIVIMIYAIWMKAFQTEKKKPIFLSPYTYILLSQLLVVPEFILNVDWGRWYIAIAAVSFFQILYLNYRGDEGINEAFLALNFFVNRHKVLCAAVLFYLASLSKFQEWGSTVEITRLLEIIREQHLSYY